jgi:hypothetical protein
MHSISLRIHDKVIDKVLYFLENLPENEVEILGACRTYERTQEFL